MQIICGRSLAAAVVPGGLVRVMRLVRHYRFGGVGAILGTDRRRRDRYVTDLFAKAYPQYQFARHKGYGTRLHYEMLDAYGPCPEHRRSFLKKWEEKR